VRLFASAVPSRMSWLALCCGTGGARHRASAD
jgi:hypothetical protein